VETRIALAAFRLGTVGVIVGSVGVVVYRGGRP
jgi:hypothetical protein